MPRARAPEVRSAGHGDAVARAIWQRPWTLSELAELTRKTMAEHLGIAFEEIGNDYLKASLPVREKTAQRMGFLHGGASLALAETVGALASQMCIDSNSYFSVGLSLDANHLRLVATGDTIFGIATPVHLGRQTHVWIVRVEAPDGKLVCYAKLTAAIRPRESAQH